MIFLPHRRKYHQPFELNQVNWHAWYDPSDTGTITESSGAVSQLDDISGNGHHLTQGTGANQPTTGTRTINSLNVLDYVNDLLRVSWGETISQPFTIFSVFQMDTTNENNFVYDGYDVSNRHYLTGNTSANYFMGTNSSISSSGQDTNAHVSSCVYNTTSSELFIDGGSIASGDVGTYNSTGISVGARDSLAGDLDGAIGELLFYAGEMTDKLRAKVEYKLSEKWGISLVSGHRYENYAPLVG